MVATEASGTHPTKMFSCHCNLIGVDVGLSQCERTINFFIFLIRVESGRSVVKGSELLLNSEF